MSFLRACVLFMWLIGQYGHGFELTWDGQCIHHHVHKSKPNQSIHPSIPHPPARASIAASTASAPALAAAIMEATPVPAVSCVCTWMGMSGCSLFVSCWKVCVVCYSASLKGMTGNRRGSSHRRSAPTSMAAASLFKLERVEQCIGSSRGWVGCGDGRLVYTDNTNGTHGLRRPAMSLMASTCAPSSTSCLLFVNVRSVWDGGTEGRVHVCLSYPIETV